MNVELLFHVLCLICAFVVVRYFFVRFLAVFKHIYVMFVVVLVVVLVAADVFDGKTKLRYF